MWRVKSRALRDARLGNMWSHDHLAKVAGVSSRTVRDYEKADPVARITTLEFLAKALSVEVRAIARPAVDGADAPAKTRGAGAPPSTDPPAPRGVTQLPRASRLEELVALERAHPRGPLGGTAWGELPPLGAKLYQDIFTAFRVHDGARAHLAARVEAQRGISTSEAAILGTRTGVGARFHLVSEVAPGHVMGVTVHTTSAADTKRLQGSIGADARVVVRVIVVPDETFERRVGLAFFFVPETPRPWGLVVDAVLDGAPPPPPLVKKEKSPQRSK